MGDVVLVRGCDESRCCFRCVCDCVWLLIACCGECNMMGYVVFVCAWCHWCVVFVVCIRVWLLVVCLNG